MENYWIICTVFASWVLGGFSSGVAGMGAGLVALPIMMISLTPVESIPICTLVGFFSASHLFICYRKFCQIKDILGPLLGVIPGSFLGIYLLQYASANTLQILLAFLICVFLLLQMVPSLAAWSIPDRTAFGIFAGLLAAAANTAVAVGGAPFGMYVALKHWLPNRARGAMAVFFFCICSFSVILQGSTGMFSLASVSLIVAGIVGCAAGQIAGVYCGRGIDARIFHRLLMFFLVLAVCFLFFKAFFI